MHRSVGREEQNALGGLLYLLTAAGMMLCIVWFVLACLVVLTAQTSPSALPVLYTSAFVFSLCFNTLKITRGWRVWTDIQLPDKAVAAAGAAAALTALILTCFFLYAVGLFAQGLQARY